ERLDGIPAPQLRSQFSARYRGLRDLLAKPSLHCVECGRRFLGQEADFMLHLKRESVMSQEVVNRQNDIFTIPGQHTLKIRFVPICKQYRTRKFAMALQCQPGLCCEDWVMGIGHCKYL